MHTHAYTHREALHVRHLVDVWQQNTFLGQDNVRNILIFNFICLNPHISVKKFHLLQHFWRQHHCRVEDGSCRCWCFTWTVAKAQEHSCHRTCSLLFPLFTGTHLRSSSALISCLTWWNSLAILQCSLYTWTLSSSDTQGGTGCSREEQRPHQRLEMRCYQKLKWEDSFCVCSCICQLHLPDFTARMRTTLTAILPCQITPKMLKRTFSTLVL